MYAQYAAARRTIGEDAPQEQKAVLKALLLQFLAEVAAKHEEQVLFLAQSAGLSERTTKQTLRTLSDANVIRYDPSYKVNSFWAASNQPKVLEEIIQKKLERYSWSMAMLDELNKTLTTLPGSYFGSMDVKVVWGHPNDWAAREYIVTVDLLDEWLKNLPKQFAFNHRDIIEADRSVVVWIVANRDDEAVSVREQVTEAFQKAFAGMSQNPPAIVAVVASRAQPELLNAFRRRWALQGFSQKERTDAGKEMYEAETKQADINLLRALQGIRLDDKLPSDIARPRDSYVLPTAYISELRASDRVALRDLLARLYWTVFAYAPSEFFTQYRVASKGVNKLRDATREVAEVLIRNAPADLNALARVKRGIIVDLCDKFLVGKWELLAPDYRIHPQPGTRRLREAWQYIDNSIKPSTSDYKLRDVLFPLLNPPYGYDYNTAFLLFAAWFGYHRLDLEVSINGRRADQTALLKLVGNGSREFFYAIAISDIVSIHRRVMPDVTEIKKRIQAVGQESFQYEIAETEVVVLREITEDERYNSDVRQSAQNAAQALTQAMGLAKQYDTDAEQIKTALTRANTAQELINLQRKIEKLPRPGNVKAQQDSPAQLQQQIQDRFIAVIETVCRDNEAPKKLTDVGLNRARLTDEKRAVATVGLPVLTQRIETSLTRLAQREDELRRALQEAERLKNLQAAIERVDPRDRLQQLLSGRTELQALNDLPDDLIRQRNNRLQQVEKAIADIYDQINQSRAALESVTQPNQLRKIRDTLVALQPRCVETTEATGIETLLQQAEAIRQRLEEQARHHAEIKQSILGIADQGSLQQLIAGASYLQSLTDLPTDLGRLRDERLNVVDKQIASIRTQIEQAQQELAAAQTVAQLNKLRNKLYTLESLCRETPEAEKIAQLLANFAESQERLTQKERQATEIYRIIQAADPKAPLKRLLESREQLQGLTDLSKDLLSKRDERFAQIEQAIGHIRTQIERTRTDLTAKRDLRTVKTIRDTLLQLQTHCADTSEEAEITKLIQQTDQVQTELEEEERCHNEWRALIKGVDPNSKRLSVLLEGRATLEALTSLPPALNQECSNRLREIAKAVSTIEKQVERAVSALDTITDRSQLDKYRDELASLRQHCEETPLEVSLVSQLERANSLRDFFNRLERERKLQTDTLANSHAQVKRLQQMAQDFEPHLSTQQKQLVLGHLEWLQKKVNELRLVARNWLVKHQDYAIKRSIPVTQLETQLSNPPAEWALLSLAEQQPLVSLRQKVQHLVDEDAVSAIESRFRQITDRQTQEECIQKLQQILVEGNNTGQTV